MLLLESDPFSSVFGEPWVKRGALSDEEIAEMSAREMEEYVLNEAHRWDCQQVIKWFESHKAGTEHKYFLNTVASGFLKNMSSVVENPGFVRFLEEMVDIIEDEDARQEFVAEVVLNYCAVHSDKAEIDEENLFFYRLTITEVLKDQMERGLNLLACLFRNKSINYGFTDRLEVKDLTPILEIVGENARVDLDDLEQYYKEAFEYRYDDSIGGPIGVVSGIIGMTGSDDADEIRKDMICWAAKHLTFTNAGRKDLFMVERFLVLCSTEEELLLMRENGSFPKETLENLIMLMRSGRQEEWEGKLPILIQWLHEG